MQQPPGLPDGVDADMPTAARVYDYLLGGVHNFAVDREMARQAIEAIPDIAVQAKANRAFLHRAVRFLVSIGMRQFLDLGSGIPTVGNVHEIVARATPDGRVVYVDIDPVAVAHAQHLLADDGHTTVVQRDLREPREVLADPELGRILDLGQPVAVLAVAVLHAVSDPDDPAGIVGEYRDALPMGSCLAIAHGTDEARPEQARRLVELSKRTPTPIRMRSRGEIERLFDGFELVEPGLVWAPLWRPDSPHQVPEHPEYSGNLVGVGCKR